MLRARNQNAAFSLVETLMGGAVASALGVAIFSFLNVGMFLSAKNLSINLTGNSVRASMDRIEAMLQQGDSSPVLINGSAATVTTGPAAGVKFDRYLGGPYVVTAPVTGLPASTTTLTITRSTHSLASAPVPRVGDVLRIDSAAAILRPRVASVSAGTIASNRQTITIGLAAPLGTTVTYVTTSVMTAKLVRQVAFIVKPGAAGRQELRFYESLETTTNLEDRTKFFVITDQVGTQAADLLPFSLVPYSGKNFVSVSLRTRAGNFDRRLSGKQADEFNSYTRVDALARPKVNP